jgi:hypothetical protein
MLEEYDDPARETGYSSAQIFFGSDMSPAFCVAQVLKRFALLINA